MRPRFNPTVSLSVKVCRRCHALLAPGAMFCSRCVSLDVAPARCRVDKRDLAAYYRIIPK